MIQYVFGYGSLICSESRAATAKALRDRADIETNENKRGRAIPVRLNNYLRMWNVRGPNTYLGVQSLKADTGAGSNNSKVQQQQQQQQKQSSRNTSCVGVLFPLPSSNDDDDDVLEALDRREIAYSRHRLNLGLIERVDDLLIRKESDSGIGYGTIEHITKRRTDNQPKKRKREDKEAIHNEYYKGTFLEKRLPPCDDEKDTSKNDYKAEGEKDEVCVWIYVPLEKYTGMARSENPILQSYVDVCLKGCLSISKSFAEKFVEGTYGWYPGHSHLESELKDKGEAPDGESSSFSCWIDDRRNPLYGRADKEYSLQHSKVLDSVFDRTILRRRTTSNTEPTTDNSR